MFNKILISLLIAIGLFTMAATANAQQYSDADTYTVPGVGLEYHSGSAIEEDNTNPFNKDLRSGVASELPVEYVAQENTNPLFLIYRIIKIMLSFLGIGTISLIVYAGARWAMSGGEQEPITQAKKTIRNAIIGLVLITMSYSLASYLSNRLQRTTGSYNRGVGIGISF